MKAADVAHQLNELGAELPKPGILFRSKAFTDSAPIRALFPSHVDDRNYHARIAQEMSAHRETLRVRVVGERTSEGVLWERY